MKSRVSGISWMLAAGRGGIIGDLAGGVLTQAGDKMAAIILGLSVPALIASVALFVKAYAAKPAQIEEISATVANHKPVEV